MRNAFGEETLTFDLALSLMCLIIYADREYFIQVFAHVVCSRVTSMSIKYSCSSTIGTDDTCHSICGKQSFCMERPMHLHTESHSDPWVL